MKAHWTQQIFVKHASLFLKVHEEFLKSAPQQSKQIAGIFARHGVKKSARILDLGCGIGRHSVYLAKRGYQVVGIDLSPAFLKRAAELAASLDVTQRTTFYRCDYRSLSRCLPKTSTPFDAVISMWSSIGYYTDEADTSILAQCRSLSRRAGMLMIETINSEFLSKHFLPSNYTEFGDILLLEERKMNLEGARVDTRWRFYQKEGRVLKHKATVSFQFRAYTLHELISTLHKAGWRYLEAFGGLAGDPLTPDARRLVVVARAD